MSEFKSFMPIERLEGAVIISEKIHGTNAQIFIDGDTMLVGSRSRWITIGDDNYGFAAQCIAHKDEIIKCLGDGRHFGEWYGRGINAGYGLSDRRLMLFRDDYETILPWMDRLCILHTGIYHEGLIQKTMSDLMLNGSRLVPGFMKPEGVVTRFMRNGALFKSVFDNEEMPREKKEREPRPDADLISAYLQPIRLEKLLSRDERYIREWPESIKNLCGDYVRDLEKETNFSNEGESLQKAIKSSVFKFLKEVIK